MHQRQRARRFALRAFFCALGFELATTLALGCGGSTVAGPGNVPPEQSVASPTIATSAAQNGAAIVRLSDATAGATLYYTTDGSTPTASSIPYFAPFLVDSSLTVKALGVMAGLQPSAVVTQTFATSIASSTLVWSDEFNSGSTSGQPDPATWTYDTGTNCCGNHELETYCAWGSTTGPCNPANPNAAVGTDGVLHVVAENPSGATYTSGRLKSQGLFTFQYGRIEARMMLPESQGMWPAFWLLGSNITATPWPACGEADIMEHIDGNNPPPYVGAAPPGYDWIAGSVHGGTSSNEANGSQQYHPTGFSAAAWHTYGMIWSKGQVQFYVDDPSNIYATYTPANFPGTWPFDQGPMFILLNLAVGGDWPGNPNATTQFPSTMLVDYVRIYTN